MDLILSAIIIVILALAVGYIIHAKKKGAKCIGCPYASSCSKKCK